jgi:Tol biopolymer transport system component
VAYYQRAPHEAGRKRVVIAPLGGGPPARTLAVANTAYLLQWSPDGRALDYAEERKAGGRLWRLPLDGGEARRLTDFAGGVISRFAWSPDGARLAVSSITWNRDAILLRLAR